MQAPEALEAARIRAALRRKLFGARAETARVGRYELLRSVGAGAMGAVFVARDTELERQVALKVLRTAEDAETVRRRLLREARAMAKLRHPNVVTVFEAGVAGDTAFIAMEYVEGTTLRGWLDASPRETEAVVDVFVQAGRGLAAAHEAGLIHRDFKPDNVLIGGDGRVQVTDFGVARAVELPDLPLGGRPATLDAAQPPSHTERARAGTPRYMAPEQHRGEAIDARTDQFAFCVALYEALAGEPPFQGASLSELAEAACRGETLSLPGHVPDGLGSAIAAGLRPDPDQRHPSMTALIETLRPAERPPVTRRWRWRLALAAAGIGAVLLTGDTTSDRLTTTITPSTPIPSAPPPAPTTTPPLGAIAIPDGPLAAGEPWLPGFRLVHHPEVDLSWLDATERCRSASLALCTETQWQRACERDDRLASVPTWTATADGDRGFVTRGAGSCAARQVARARDRHPTRGGICCSRAVAMVGQRTETANRIMSETLARLESALGQAHIPILDSMTGDRVDHRGDAMSKDRFLAVLLSDARREPDRWELFDTCDGTELPREGERAWAAECRTLVYRGGRIGVVQRRFAFSGPDGTLSAVQEPLTLRELSAPTR